jgi:hypothetical protein
MPFTILHDGRIQTDDPAEAMRISKMIRAAAAELKTSPPAAPPASKPSQAPPPGAFTLPSPAKASPAAASTATPATPTQGVSASSQPALTPQQLAALYHSMEAALSPEQRTILRTLRDRRKMSVEEMMGAMGVTNGNAIGGVLGGMSKRIEKLNVKLTFLMVKAVEGETISYLARPMLTRWATL